MAAQEKICPKCNQSFEPSFRACPLDGSKLLTVGDVSVDRIGMVIDDKFTILGLLGKGGMGTVYRARQHSMDREVALKILKSDLSESATIVRRFLQEAKTASKLSHPHTVTLFDFGQTDQGELYISMELLDGRVLADIIEHEGMFETARAVNLVCQVCEALHDAHGHGLIHRDVKPDNIIVMQGRSSEFVKVLDFGIAKVETLDGAESITKTGLVCGTPAYMSPEQATDSDIDCRTDVYAVGIVLYELLAGVRPFKGCTSPVQELMARVLQEPVPLREAGPGVRVPEAVEQVVMQSLAKHPNDRPATAAEFADRLKSAMDAHQGNPSFVELSPVDTQTGVEREPIERALRNDPTGAYTRAVPGVSGTLDARLVDDETVDLNEAGLVTEDTIGAALDSEWKRRMPLIAIAVALVGIGSYWGLGEHEAATPPDRPILAPARKAPPAPQPKKTEKAVTAPEPLIKKSGSAAPEQAEKKPRALPQVIRVVTQPEGAAVYFNGERVGAGPLDLPRPEKSGLIEVKHRGYKDQRVVLEATHEGSFAVTLQKKKPRKKTHRKTNRRGGAGMIE